MRVVHLDQERRAMALDPAAHAHPRQALGDELQLAAFAAGMVHAHQGAVVGQGVRVEVARVFRRIVHEEQRQAVMLGLGDQLQGFRPGFLVDDHRQHLRREERAVVDRDHIDGVGQILPRQRQTGGEDFLRAMDIVNLVLVAHEAPD
ncbi:hypothetical protein D3C78_1158230 [compost metagenome]